MKRRTHFSILCGSVVAIVALVALAVAVIPALRPPPARAYTVTVWEQEPTLHTGRQYHTASLLPNNRVLVAGGSDSNHNALASAEVYSPLSRTWSAAASLATARAQAAATVLADGDVLVVGGINQLGQSLTSAERYHPATNSWSAAGNLVDPSNSPVTLLPNGRVLASGFDPTSGTSVVETYDPASNTWTTVAPFDQPRYDYSATLLQNGRVLVAGGEFYTASGVLTQLASAEIYDPTANTWTTVASMNVARNHQTATLLPNGKVFVEGGCIISGSGNNECDSAETYDPTANTWTLAAPPLVKYSSLGLAGETATLLRNGTVLVAGGGDPNFPHSQIYNPATNRWTYTPAMVYMAANHTATLLGDGSVLIAGGCCISNGQVDGAEAYYPETPPVLTRGTWTLGAPSPNNHLGATPVLLQNGQVLVTQGSTGAVDLYNPATNTWSSAATFSPSVADYMAAVLPDGRVLVAGGCCDYNLTPPWVASAEIYDPTANSWTTVASMNMAREGASTVALSSGKVLVISGDNSTAGDTEIYDPSANTWTNVANPNSARAAGTFTATLLPSGNVLVTGGDISGNPKYAQSGAEIYDPTANTWTQVAPMHAPREFHTATLLPNGNVLVTGGCCDQYGNALASAEIYNPTANTWTLTLPMLAPHSLHSATLLTNGSVLVAGGFADQQALAETELYYPATNTWRLGAWMNVAADGQVALSLPNGRALIFSGSQPRPIELYGPWSLDP